MTEPITFDLNGAPTSAECRADRTVLEWLRGDALLRGTKEGCAEGDCGACSILMRAPDDDRYRPANSCILLMGQVEGASLMTVEGLAAMGPDGHPVQSLMAENGSSQCGFCTPGIVCALAGLGDGDTAVDEPAVHEALAGNLCRCTGYRPIVEAALATAPVKLNAASPSGGRRASVGSANSQMHHPGNFEELWAVMKTHPGSPLLAGGTDDNLSVAQAHTRHDNIISLRAIAELARIETNATHLSIGGAARWCDMLPHLEMHWPSFAAMLRRFGSVQVRSVSTMGGNLATASPIGDSAPSLIALDSALVLKSSAGERRVSVEDFYTGYRETILRENEVIAAIEIPLSKDVEFRVYKVSKRYDQDISTVCGAFSVRMDGEKIASARIAFGGMAATPVRCRSAESLLVGKPLEALNDARISDAIEADLAPMSDMRGTANYRMRVARNLPKRLALDLSGEIVEVMAL
ncbi:xanthine dehydrogenase small subunit [Ahrensia sp. R2A130]|uniref:xanthine dehydrogenase small subunit n=1 Tax=Ahrensia sp. R2A130 TaxID=744979 RepID=UPI00058E28F7|nr:FAD binding domain-containing protein [Ahrensia sp. R2A130]